MILSIYYILEDMRKEIISKELKFQSVIGLWEFSDWYFNKKPNFKHEQAIVEDMLAIELNLYPKKGWS